MSRYPDVPEDHLFYQDIEDLALRGMVGVPDGGNYRPNDPITRGESAAYINRVLNALGYSVFDFEPEPLVEPPEPPEGMYIPVLEGPKLYHDGNPTVMSGYQVIDDGKDHLWENVLLRGRVYVKNGTLTILDSEIDGQDGPYCVLGTGNVWLERVWLHNAEDGTKNNVSGNQVTINNLSPNYRTQPHADCIQLESSAPDVRFQWSYFDAHYKNGGGLGNAAVQAKTDFSSNQKVTLEDCYINGGNYTVFLRPGNAGGAAKGVFRRCLWGGDANWGQNAEGQIVDRRKNPAAWPTAVESVSYKSNAIEWDVTRI